MVIDEDEDGNLVIDYGNGPRPYSNNNDDDDDDCFIATAAYGSIMEPHVVTLRNFRDTYLKTNKAGRSIVETYYKYSPPIAEYIAQHESLKAPVRIGLAPVIGFSWLAVNHGLAVALITFISFLSLFIGGTFYIANTRKTY